jgi:hypothetical protein
MTMSWPVVGGVGFGDDGVRGEHGTRGVDHETRNTRETRQGILAAKKRRERKNTAAEELTTKYRNHE